MCEMLNVFVPQSGFASAPVRGFALVEHGEVHPAFRARFARERGVILVGTGPRGCLCGFGDWPALYEIVREAIERLRLDGIAAVRFWSGDERAAPERVIYLDEAFETPALGELVRFRTTPHAVRRHRDVVDVLRTSVGRDVVLRMRGGPAVRGRLVTFDAESEIATVDDRVVTVWAIESAHRATLGA